MTQHFSRLGHTPFWHLCVPKGAEMTSGGVSLSHPYLLFFREFRPIDSQQSSSHLFHPSTEEILLGGGVSACGLWLVLFGLLLGCLCPFLHHNCISLPSMMTWAPCPHGVRTRGKKKCSEKLCEVCLVGVFGCFVCCGSVSFALLLLSQTCRVFTLLEMTCAH